MNFVVRKIKRITNFKFRLTLLKYKNFPSQLN